MPIRIRCLEKNSDTLQQVEINSLRREAKPFLKASYAAIETMYVVLCGSA